MIHNEVGRSVFDIIQFFLAEINVVSSQYEDVLEYPSDFAAHKRC